MQVWRLCKAKFAATAFLGEGARLYSGRWNPAGVRIVYTSTSLALAAVEFFVHLDPTVTPEDMVVTRATIPEMVFIERITLADLPLDWKAIDNLALQQMGLNWVTSQRCVALQVPSVAVEGDWNVLLNPTHPDFARIIVEGPHPWRFDDRMFIKAFSIDHPV